MSITISPVTPDFAAEIGDVDLSKPLVGRRFRRDPGRHSGNTRCWSFPSSTSRQEQHLAFSERFGPVENERTLDPKATPSRLTAASSPTSRISLRTARSGARPAASACTRPATSCGTPTARSNACRRCARCFTARTIAPDRRTHGIRRSARGVRRIAGRDETEAARASSPSTGSCIRAVAAALPNSTRTRCSACRRCRRCWCARIPQNGRKSLYVASHAGRIFGMPEAEGRALIDELIAHATQRQFVYTHRWRPNELVMWDNRCTMHRGTDYDDLRWVRDMRARDDQRCRQLLRAGRRPGRGCAGARRNGCVSALPYSPRGFAFRFRCSCGLVPDRRPRSPPMPDATHAPHSPRDRPARARRSRRSRRPHLGQKLTEAWGQQVIPADNRAGVNGVLGSAVVAKSAPDGYTLLMGKRPVRTASMRASMPGCLRTVMISRLSRAAHLELRAGRHPSLPARDVKELIRLAEAKPGDITCASAVRCPSLLPNSSSAAPTSISRSCPTKAMHSRLW